MKKLICAIFLIINLTSCIKNPYRTGYLFDLSDHQLVQEGITSKERVLKIMGSPTIISNLDEETWIYYSEDSVKVLFFIPDIKERTILTFKFDKSEIVKDLERFNLSDENQQMKFTSQYTEVSSNKIGFFKSIFSNVGQVKAAQ